MIVSTYSNRIYKNTIGSELQSMLIDCIDIKIKLYSDIVNKKVHMEDVNTTYVATNYHVNCYYANMIIRDLKAVIKSQEELQQIYLDDYNNKIITQQEKINKLTDKLTYWLNMKEELLSYIESKQYKVVFPYKMKDNTVIHKYKTYTLYEFELYIHKRLKQIRNSLYHAKNKINRLNQKQANLKVKSPVCCFGNKAFFKKQFTLDTYKNDHQLWKEEFFHKRHKHFVINGQTGSIDGSYCVRYNRNSQTLSIMSHKQGETSYGKKVKQEHFTIPCVFKYRNEEYLNTINNREKVAYEMCDYGDYFIIKAVFDVYNTEPMVKDISKGVCSIDINVDRFALTELDHNGNLLERKVIYFDLDGASKQNTKTLEKAAIEVADFCLEANKPLVRENIKNIKFKATKDTKTNKTLSQFAYDEMLTIIDRCSYKHGIQVYKTNPAYTSQQGKIKYMADMGLSIHESAAFCIGRRYLFSTYDENGKFQLYYENMNQYSRFGSIKSISKEFKKLSVNSIYRLKKIPINLDDYKKLNQYIKAVNDYVYS